ncbi:hypothetical protein C8N24_0355 [Solirubrobacter pauli]|uniref:Uncharacterized protein n=1 Tax=Solirubrobacter pauli TaxID=166793 RepID=A0A660L7S4_9ACTN|nr:hypothetical protein C8N24_0355 [Solirubrobacter pauli]
MACAACPTRLGQPLSGRTRLRKRWPSGYRRSHAEAHCYLNARPLYRDVTSPMDRPHPQGSWERWVPRRTGGEQPRAGHPQRWCQCFQPLTAGLQMVPPFSLKKIGCVRLGGSERGDRSCSSTVASAATSARAFRSISRCSPTHAGRSSAKIGTSLVAQTRRSMRAPPGVCTRCRISVSSSRAPTYVDVSVIGARGLAIAVVTTTTWAPTAARRVALSTGQPSTVMATPIRFPSWIMTPQSRLVRTARQPDR